ncbi:hypothetical protein L198_05423 [Cryptococcus wingfieldii CBS 7118]|uniref:Protein kinase domain-containing protein n=1 Tax=Cryptococcus wingfieldii CBS 7118 TaxID=1295528 RepID=A0A1E3IY60_9TREE|nr:hypothetical protein L198_05423 [Cryptococcus wingfieldii CBS 7118]ODN93557.1 hypothetical protein L198_05423 [Cryptococcus wingfieldii CBS 7118]
MDRLGPSLDSVMEKTKEDEFSLKTTLQIMDQVITRIQALHERHYIHRGIKPDNFCIGLPGSKTENTVYMIDFDNVKVFRDPETHMHIPYQEDRNPTVNPYWSSLTVDSRIESSRRDDMESAGYMAVFFLKGCLPWWYERECRPAYPEHCQKKDTTLEYLCADLPEELSTYISYSRSLKFDDEPDYEYCRGLLRRVFEREGYKDDGVYDWARSPQVSAWGGDDTDVETSEDGPSASQTEVTEACSTPPIVPSVQEEQEQQDGTDASSPSKPGIVERASDILREAFGKPKKAEITPSTTEHVEHTPPPPLSECTTSTAPADQDISEHHSSSIPQNISSPPTAIDIPSPAGNLSEIIHHGAPLTGRPQSKKKASLGGEEGSTVVDRAVGVGLEGVEDTPMGERSNPFSSVPLGELGLGAKPTPVAPSSEHGEIESDGSDSEEESGQLARGVRESAPEPVDPQSEGNTNIHFSSQPRILPAFDTKPYVPPSSHYPSQPQNQTSPSLSPKTSPKQETITLPIYPLPASPSRSISAPIVSSPSSAQSTPLPLPISSRGAPGQRDVPRIFPSLGSVVAEPAWSREGSPELGSELEVIPSSPPPSSLPKGLSLEQDEEEEYHPGKKRDHEPRLCEPRSEGPESLAFGSLRVHSPGSSVSPLSPVSPDITTPPSVYDSASASAASGGGTGVHSGSGSGVGTGTGTGTGKGKAPPLPSTLVATLQQQAEEQEEGAGLKKLTPIHPEE